MSRVAAAARACAWPLFVLGAALTAVTGVFTTERIFYIRDLSFFFWSRHLWLRGTIFSGQPLWWDPHVAGGQSAIADALNQILMPVTLAVRLLPSDVISFNLWVALPLPIAGIGMFYFLRRRGDAAAALGACIFTLAGPTVSLLNLPNMAWSVAFVPWVLWAVGTAGAASRYVTRIAILYSLQALCGEPVTWVATGVLAAAYSMFGIDPAPHGRPGASTAAIRRGIATVGALAAGALLASAQLLPTFLAGIHAHRAAVATPDFWSLHPLSLWEALAPDLFGNYYDAFLTQLPWMGALNFGRDPFFYSLYLGPPVLLLAALALAAAPRRNAFWAAVAAAAVLAALGGYTPVYPLIRRLVPALMYFRFPVKYLVFAIFACAVLAADGWERCRRSRDGARSAPRTEWMPATIAAAGIAATVGLFLTIAVILMPGLLSTATAWLASSTHLKDPAEGAAFLDRTLPPLAARTFALLLAATVLAAAASRFRFAAAVLFAAVAADLAVTNGGLNPTMALAKLMPPAWYREAAGPQRLYIGGRVRGSMNPHDADGARTWQIPAERTAVEGRMELNAQLPMAPSGWRVREALSYDLPVLWPAEYDATVRRFEAAGRDERAAFLRRSGVRRCVLPDTEPRQYHVVAGVPDWNMRVFDCNVGASRVFLTSAPAVAADPEDLAWQREALFDPSLPDDTVRLATAPGIAHPSSSPGPDDVRISEDLATRVSVEATLRESGVLVLRDSYDPSWRATVDGVPAPVIRANAIYRAVALAPGHHVIRFFYRPRDLTAGLMVSVTTGVLLAAWSFSRRRTSASRPPRGMEGFTLIELMVVLAVLGILLAIAFTQYRGMQARGNEASAVGSLRAIVVAQSQFSLTCAKGKYASTLPGLAQPIPATGEGFLSPDLTPAETFEKSGYVFKMAAKPLDDAPPACNGAAVADGYAVTADPAKPGVSGNRYYGVNADRVLYSDDQQTFTENLGESGPAGHGVEVK